METFLNIFTPKFSISLGSSVWLERTAVNRKVAGSNPARGANQIGLLRKSYKSKLGIPYISDKFLKGSWLSLARAHD